MKKTLTPIMPCFAAIASFAQTADIEVSDTALSPNFKNGKVDVKNLYVLLANTMGSKFFSPITESLDLLNSPPEGAAKWRESQANPMIRYSHLTMSLT